MVCVHGVWCGAISGGTSVGDAVHRMRAPAPECRAFDVQTTVVYGLPNLTMQ